MNLFNFSNIILIQEFEIVPVYKVVSTFLPPFIDKVVNQCIETEYNQDGHKDMVYRLDIFNLEKITENKKK